MSIPARLTTDYTSRLNGGSVPCPPAVTCLALMLILGASVSSAQSQRHTRQYLTTKLVLERTVGVGDGVVLERPAYLKRLPDGGMVLFDHGSRSLRAFGSDGSPLWTAGRRGGGPGEFAGVADIRVARNGDVVVLDDDNQRLTTILATGTVGTMERLDDPAERLLGIDGGSKTVLVPYGIDTLWRAVEPNRSGRVRWQPTAPDVRKASARIAATGFTTESDGRSVVVFEWSDLFVVLAKDGGIARVFHGVDAVPFPAANRKEVSPPKGLKLPNGGKITTMRVTRVDPQARRVTHGADLWGNTLLVITRLENADSTTVLDAYDITSGSYIGSLKLPVRTNSVAVLDDHHIAAIDAELVPVVRIWRVVPDGPQPLVLEQGGGRR